MKLLLTGDIGGTKTLLSLEKSETDRKTVTLHSDRYPSQNYKSLKEIVDRFLEEASTQFGYTPEIDTACFGIAGPVINNTSYLTNLNWQLDGNQLQADLGIDRVVLINDFAAVGYGVVGLAASDLHTLQIGKHQPQAPIAIIGAGTGLGQGFLTWNQDRYEVHASEGGHGDFAPRSPKEIELLNFLLTRHERISTERVVSGKGIVSIYQFLQHINPETTELSKMLKAWEDGDLSIDMGAAIANATLLETDPTAMEAIQIFLDAYAAEIGNLALKFLPYGGLYIAGGITPKLLSLISTCEDSDSVCEIDDRGRFMSILKHKGRVSPMLDAIPIHVVLNQNVGLIGTTLYGSYLQQAKTK
jgi:glucokinase